MKPKTPLSLTSEQKRELIAEVVGHRFCLQPKAVRRWMDKNQVYDLNEIIDRSNDFETFLSEILKGGDWHERQNKGSPHKRP